jgi:hypothetical protein
MSQKAKAEKGKSPAQIQFYASLPPIQSALKISGDGDNLRVQLDIPIRISPDGLKLALFTQKRLLVVVMEAPESLTELDDAAKKIPKRSIVNVDRRRFAKRRD